MGGLATSGANPHHYDLREGYRVAADHTLAIFAAELILLLLFGRLLGELMNRVGQPALFGQLLAGVLLGPSVFGMLFPELRHAVFPDNKTLKSMIDAISQIGILLLLLLTGMETNLAVVQRPRRALASTSLAASLTIGRRLVARLILWVNDHMTIEVPVIPAILVVMLGMALTTELIGVHTALGAFVAGILIGQSPILTEHIERELRGFIMAFFSPVFFAVAGLGMDLRTLMDPTLLMFTGAVILVASLGKFSGALVGGRLGGLTVRESLAMAIGLNARDTTEVVIAAIGLHLWALSKQIYTKLVALADHPPLTN